MSRRSTQKYESLFLKTYGWKLYVWIWLIDCVQVWKLMMTKLTIGKILGGGPKIGNKNWIVGMDRQLCLTNWPKDYLNPIQETNVSAAAPTEWKDGNCQLQLTSLGLTKIKVSSEWWLGLACREYGLLSFHHC